MANVTVRRLQDPPVAGEGRRVLAELASTQGLARGPHVDLYLPALAPSAPLAAWFHADPSRWEEFRIQYQRELEGNPEVRHLAELAQAGDLVLLTMSADPARSPAAVLRGLLRGR